ncbi:RNA polymerase sigma-70 factor, ECF subfamily, HasI [Pseudomonas sp. M47T1]|uniref:RNA polymerase sigma factor n=1 Tax=Pseudomonas sp. M47T1 TaxID=1179778 RepID=UPI0002608612|nr:sigma-70 family RNA polymerase sigma factor [Pseudomonas sp. M47T1]EIK93643.1 RNA polymerase sigma-70 factor, ECF subfamily, HasI [Pseudomonas sp. M47T1]
MSEKELTGLFLGHARALRGYLAKRLADPQLAADLVQESFLRLAEQQRQGKVEHCAGYLYQIARNLLVDHLRQQARRNTHSVPPEALTGLEDPSACVELLAMAEQQRQSLRHAMASLPPRTREVLRLNRLEGLTHAEVACKLEISDSSVQKHLAKGLAIIMQRLQ